MTKLQFRILYREFLFRMVDLELLSAHAQGETTRLLGQFAALLVFISLCFAGSGLAYFNSDMPRIALLVGGWGTEHTMIATTMLVIGLFAVLSWDSTFPDRRDVLVLAPLPVRARTMFRAKIAALTTALALTVGLLHLLAGILWPIALVKQNPPITVPMIAFDPAIPPVEAADLEEVLARDLQEADVRSAVTGAEPHPAGWGVSIGVVKHGTRRVFQYGGARPDSLYQIGAITKTFTTLSLARMVADNTVRLDRPVRTLLREAKMVRPRGREISLLDLATDRSSLAPLPWNLPNPTPRNPHPDYTVEDLMDFATRNGLRAMGDQYEETPTGTAVLGVALSRGAGLTYPEMIAEQITIPLGMQDTVFTLTPELSGRLRPGNKGGERTSPLEGYSAFLPALGIYSTASDMLAYLEALLHPERYTGSLGKALAWSHESQGDINQGMQVGLGWKYRNAQRIWFFEGSMRGYSSYAFFSPANDYAAVVLMNQGPGIASSAPRLGEHIRHRLMGQPARPLANALIPTKRSFGQFIRTLFSWWVTMFAAGGFIFCSILTAQGLAAQLPRRYFLRLSSFLQLASFCLFLSVYFLQPPIVDPFGGGWDARLLDRLPSYWFFGMFHYLNGSMHPEFAPLANRAFIATACSVAGAGCAFLVSYFRTIRRIVEEPDIVPGSRGWNWLPRFGNALQTAIVQFSIRTLLRSRLHRVILAFYLGMAGAFTIMLVKTPLAAMPAGAAADWWHQPNVPLLASSLLMLGFWVVGARVVFAMPLDMRANWIFRITPVRGGRVCMAARRRSLWVLGVSPVWVGSATLFFWLWPWREALGHLALLLLVGAIVVEASLRGTQKIPFTCSYLPARGNFHPFWIFIGLPVMLVVRLAELERQALENPPVFSGVLAGLAILAVVAWWIMTPDKWEEVPVEFEEVPVDHIQTLGLPRDGGRVAELVR